jgi:hypothetical protein
MLPYLLPGILWLPFLLLSLLLPLMAMITSHRPAPIFKSVSRSQGLSMLLLIMMMRLVLMMLVLVLGLRLRKKTSLSPILPRGRALMFG